MAWVWGQRLETHGNSWNLEICGALLFPSQIPLTTLLTAHNFKKFVYINFFLLFFLCETYICLMPTEVRECYFDPLELELQMIVSHHVGAWN